MAAHVHASSVPETEALDEASPCALTVQSFVRHFGEFLEALHEIYPTDVHLNERLLQFKVGIGHLPADTALRRTNEKRLIDEFHASLHTYFDRMLSRDERLFLDEELSVPILSEFRAMFAGAPADVRDTTWEYISLLVQHAVAYKMYDRIPPKLGDAIANLTSRVESGGIEPEDMNVARLSAELLSGVDPEDIQRFAIGLVNDPQAMQDLMRVASSQMTPATASRQ